MALQFSTTVLNARLDAVETAIGVGPQLRLYSGSAPANCATAASGTLIATITLPSDWMNAAASGVKTLLGSWSGACSTPGTIGHFRIYDSTGTTCHAQGSVGTSGTDMIVSPSATLTLSQPFAVTTFTLTDPNS